MRAAAYVVVLLACAACASGARSSTTAETPEQLLARAIEQAGGAEALERARALTWEGDATVHAGGRTIEITGRWQIQPPDTAVVSTYAVARGPETVRHLVVAAPRGWVVDARAFTPMQPGMLANERDQFYLYSVLRLVPLRAPGVTLAPVPPDSLGQRGFRVRQPGRPDVEVYVDAAGRVAHLRTAVADAATGEPAPQDIWLGGTLEDGGVRWPQTLRITLRGAPYFDLTLRNLRVQPAVQDTLVAGPR